MRGRLCFEDLKTALGHSLICPCPLEACTLLARVLPNGTGPAVELHGDRLLVEGVVWRFKRPCDSHRISELMETYFRGFDPDYKVTVVDVESPSPREDRTVSVR